MSIFNPFTWSWGKKAYPYDTQSIRKMSRDTSHPEEHKARDAIEANKDAQVYRTNNDIVASYVKAMQSGVVGTGFTLQYKSEDTELNKKVEWWLEYWSEMGNCDIKENFFRADLERFQVSEHCVKGTFLIRHHWDKRLKTLYNTEMLSTNVIDREKNDFAKGLFWGVQTNKLGKISGIWIYKNNQRQESSFNSIKNLILYTDVWADSHQVTGITPLAPVLNKLDTLASYENSEVKNAKRRNEKSVIIATEAYSIMLEAQKEAIASAMQKNNEADLAKAQEDYSQLIADFSASGLHEGATPIMPGDNTKVWDLQTTGTTVYADINENVKRTMSRALGLSASTVVGLSESSYNVALKNAQGDEREYAIVAQKVVEKISKPTYRNAIEAGYLLGHYNISDYYTNKDKYDSYLKITRKQIGHIDPLKQNLGDAQAVESGFTSKVAVIASRGGDADDVIADEISYELKRKKAFEDAKLTYVQTGTEKIALEKVKKEVQEQDEEENKSGKDKDEK